MTTITPSTAEEALLANLLLRINSVLENKVDGLVQAERLGQAYSFAAGRPVFEKTIALYRLLAVANFELVTEAKLNQLIEFTDQIVIQLAQIKAFQPVGNNAYPAQGRDQQLTNFKTVFEQAFNVISSVLAVSQPQNLGQYESEARASAEKLKTLFDELKTHFDEEKNRFEDIKNAAQKDLSETLAKARQAAQEVGIVQHEIFFRSEANEHKKMATIWLVATMLLAIGTGDLGWVNYIRASGLLQSAVRDPLFDGHASYTALTIQLGIAKLIMFSILFSAVLWAGRIYRAHRHNYVINKHRQNALSTFEAFVKATEDAPTKNAVLLQATQCIFGPQNTGYLAQEKESDGPTQILEIIRGATSAKN